MCYLFRWKRNLLCQEVRWPEEDRSLDQDELSSLPKRRGGKGGERSSISVGEGRLKTREGDKVQKSEEKEIANLMTGEVTTVDTSDLCVSRDPAAVLAEAKNAARALTDVIAMKTKPVIFNGEQYLEFEDWQTVAKFYNLTVKVESTEYVTFGEVAGFQARAVVIHGPTGRVITAAEAMCLNDEEKWSSRPKYEWQYVWKSTGKAAPGEPPKEELIWEKGTDGKNRPKKERVLVGEDRVPLFQLRSMAQTRSCAKAFRQVLAWVVVLAGYKATPAEEMTGAQDARQSPKILKIHPSVTEAEEDKEFNLAADQALRAKEAEILPSDENQKLDSALSGEKKPSSEFCACGHALKPNQIDFYKKHPGKEALCWLCNENKKNDLPYGSARQAETKE
mgnify:CR=1 FL=1